MLVQSSVLNTLTKSQRHTISHLWLISTFPYATVVVAMSRTKVSLFVAGAAQEMGFVPVVNCLLLVGFAAGVVFVNENPFLKFT